MEETTRPGFFGDLADAMAAKAAIEAAEPAARCEINHVEWAPRNPDGSYVGTVATDYAVWARLADGRTGNGVCRKIEAVLTPEQAREVVAGMKAELAAAARRTRKAVAVERELDRE